MEDLVRYIQILQPYYLWRIGVMERDNFTCQDCGKKGRQKTILDFPKLPVLYVIHKKSISNIIKEYNVVDDASARSCKALWDISNGKTVCIKCYHKNQYRKVALKFLKK